MVAPRPRILACWNAAHRNPTREFTMKAVIDFSYAAFVAAMIGLAVGGTAFSFVWLMHILKI
jgi:hypothetical protein